MVMLQRVDSSLPLQAAISTVVKYNADYPSCRMRLQTKYIDNYPIVLTDKMYPRSASLLTMMHAGQVCNGLLQFFAGMLCSQGGYSGILVIRDSQVLAKLGVVTIFFTGLGQTARLQRVRQNTADRIQTETEQ